MPETARKVKPFNTTIQQARHLLRERRVMVVLPVEPQPNGNVTTILQDTNEKCRWYAKFWDLEWKAPYQPGDVVPLRERWQATRPSTGNIDHDFTTWNWWYYASDNEQYRDKGIPGGLIPAGDRFAQAEDVCAVQKYLPASKMPPEAIRLRPVVEKVECRRVNSITAAEVKETGVPLPEHYIEDEWGETPDCHRVAAFAADWNRRYRRCGEEYGFDRAWAWFTTFVLKGE